MIPLKVLDAEIAGAMCRRWHLACTHLPLLPVVVLLLVGCGVQPASVPILDQCPLPCWAGITPGETTRTQVHDILTTRYGEENVSTHPAGTIDWTAPQPDEMVGMGHVSFKGREGEDDVVNSIALEIQEGNLTVEQLLEKIGDPAEAIILYETNDSYGHALKCVQALLSFPSLGVIAFLKQIDGTVGVVDSQHVDRIYIYPPGRGIWFEGSFTLKWGGYEPYCSR